jgi:transcriptional regulator with XRE-family HTH domain
MNIYAEVNPHLRNRSYLADVAVKHLKPGSPKGQPKPAKRTLDPKFPARLLEAMHGMTVSELARSAKCTRAVLCNYLNGKNKTIEALLLFKIADVLDVSVRWLLIGEGTPDRHYRAQQTEAILAISKIAEDVKTRSKKRDPS